MTRWNRHVLSCLGVAFVAACGGDDITGNSGDPLEPGEAAAVMAVISDILGDALIDLGGGPAKGASAEIPVNESFNASAICPLGGSVGLSGRITGDVDEEGSTADLDFDFTETIRDCGVAHETTQFTVNGAPNLRYSGSLFLALSGDDFTFNGQTDLVGGFSYSSSDGRRGSCRVDVRYTYTSSGVATVSGQVCGGSAGGLSSP